MFTLANQPQGIGRNLDNGFRLFKSGIKGALGIMLIMIGSGIVLAIVMGLVMGAALAPFINAGATGQIPQFGAGTFVMFLIAMIVAGLFFIYFSSAIILNYSNIAYARETGIGNALSGAFSRLLPAFGAMVILMIILGILMIPGLAYQFYSMQSVATGEGSLIAEGLTKFAIDIPYYFFSITLSFTLYRAVIDNYGPLSAVTGSHKLVWGNFWRTLLWLLIIYFIIFVLFMAVIIPTFGTAFLFGEADPGSAASAGIIGALLMLILMMFVFPFAIAMTVPYYHDLKLRKEGGDLAAKISAA